MTDEQSVLRSFRAMNDRQQKNMVLSMAAIAKKFPRDFCLKLVPISPRTVDDGLG